MIYLKLLLSFLKIGAFTFGGGYAMIVLIQEEVLRHGWLTNEELINFIAVSESTPGPLAANMATYVGMELAGIPGAACATLGVILPSFLIILAIAGIFEQFKRNRVVKGCMRGLKPAVIGFIGATVLSVGKTVFFGTNPSFAVFGEVRFYVSLLIFGLSLWLAFCKKHPILLICLAAGMGILCGYCFGF